MLRLQNRAIPSSAVLVPCYNLKLENESVVLVETDENVSFDPTDPNTFSESEKQHWQAPHQTLVGLVALESQWVTRYLSQGQGRPKITLDGTVYDVSPVFDNAKVPDKSYQPMKLLK